MMLPANAPRHKDSRRRFCMRPMLAAVAVALLPSVAIAQTQVSPTPDPLVAELRTLNRTLSEVLQLLRERVAIDRSSLVLRRVETERSSLRASEERLRALGKERDEIEEARLERLMLIDQWRAQLQGGQLDDTQKLQLESMLAQSDAHLKRIEQQSADLRAEAAVTENEIATRRRELQSLQDWVDTTLKKP